MTRPLRLASIMLLLGAGVVIAAPAVTQSGKSGPSEAAAPARQAAGSEFVLHVDRKSGCVWRVSAETGRRNLDPLPCKRPKLKAQKVEQPAVVPQVTAANQPVPGSSARPNAR